MSLKQKAYNHCLQLIAEKVLSMQNALKELSEGSKNDSKSSAGDKHETALSMMQIEQEKISKQLSEVLEQKAVLEKIDITTTPFQIIKGSLVKTNQLILFISVALGKINIENTTIIALSPQSPLGIKLMGLKEKDSTEINGVIYIIESIE